MGMHGSKLTGGTGLGLAIVKHIVAKNDADMVLESEQHIDTSFRYFAQVYHGKFYITFPCIQLRQTYYIIG